MDKSVWITRASKTVVTTLVATLFSFSHQSAQADFYTSTDLGLPANQSVYKYVDQSSDGSVVATAEGCEDCYLLLKNGYAKVSTDGGVSFNTIPIGIQNWSAVEVSSDGTRIVFFTTTAFYISTNSGSSFTKVNALKYELQQQGSQILDGAISGDGKTVFITESFNSIAKFTYKTDDRRWTEDFWVENYANRRPTAIATNYEGNKTYIASEWTGIASLVGTTVSLLPNTETSNGEGLLWGEVRTSDSGNEVVALAGIASRGGTVYKSNNGGASFTPLTTINSQNVAHVTAVEVSGDGNATFFSTTTRPDLWSYETILYTQHGKTANWLERQKSYDLGQYYEMKSDYTGSILIGSFKTGFLRVFKGAPLAPLITGVSVANADSLALSWSSGFDAGSDTTQAITDVVVEYSTSNTGPWTVYDDGVSGGNSGTITIGGFSPRTNYYFRIKTLNPFGVSPYSQVGSGFTYEQPSRPPAPTLVVNNAKWKHAFIFNPSTDTGGSNSLVADEWQFSVDGGQSWNSSASATFVATRGIQDYTPALLISEVTPGTTVSIRTRYSNGVRWSEWSASTSATFFGYPTAPRNLQVNTVFTTATLTWTPPSYLGGYTISQYSYGYKPSSDAAWVRGTTTDTTTTITGLTGGANYDYQVFAEMVDGPNSLVTYNYNNLSVSPPTKLSMNRNSAGAKSGQAFTTQPKVSILDGNNGLVTGDSLSTVYAQINKGASFIGPDSATAVSGVATFSNFGIRGAAGTQYTITYTSGDLLVATETVTLQAGNKASMRFTQNTVGGTNDITFPTQPEIELLDSEGNRVTWDDTTTVTMTTSNGFFGNNSSSTSTQAIDGLITFSGEKIRALVGTPAVLTYSTSGITSIQETLTITIGAPYAFERITRAEDAYIGGVFGTQPRYKIIDIANNIVTTGEYYISIEASQGTLTGQTTVRAVEGIATFTNLGIVGVNAGSLVRLSVYSDGLTTYSGDSVVTRQAAPRLNWSNYYLPRGLAPFTIPAPDSNTAGTITYSSSNTNVLSISGSTVTVVGAGTATITATFTPENTTNFTTGETVTATFTISAGSGTLLVALSGGSTVAKGVVKTITATASNDGAVTFYINGKRVPGCVSVKTQSSVATCNWKPSVQGSVTLSAILFPNDSEVSNVKSTPINLAIGRRTGRR